MHIAPEKMMMGQRASVQGNPGKPSWRVRGVHHLLDVSEAVEKLQRYSPHYLPQSCVEYKVLKIHDFFGAPSIQGGSGNMNSLYSITHCFLCVSAVNL
jgi:hypothetical protein